MTIAQYELLDKAGNVIPLAKPLTLTQIDGLGMPDVQHISERGAQQHGETYISSWLKGRTVNLAFTYSNGCPASVWEVREQFVYLASQFIDGFTLRAKLPTGAVRCIDLRYVDGLSLPRTNVTPNTIQAFVMQCKTFDNPTLYDPQLMTLSWTMGAAAGSWSFPLGFPAGFGASILSPAPATIPYPGTWDTYPTIRINGPADDAVITNTSTGEKLDFTGYTLLVGHYIEIDLTPGVKTVLLDGSANLIDKLTDDSDLGTFHMGKHPDVPNGDNTITVVATGAGPTTSVIMTYYIRYVGA
jgi:hypothetical protein